MSELRCASCGKLLSEPTRFCPECGARLPDPQTDAPSSWPATPPSEGLRTVVLPPQEAAGAPQAAGSAPIPPTVRLDSPEPRPGTMPAPPLGAPLPPPSAYDGSAAPAAPQRRTLWWVLGGAGCFLLVLAGACLTIGVLTLLGQRAPTPSSLSATEAPASGGILPDDSPLTGGDVLVEDDFSSARTSDLDVSEDETSRSAYEEGAYIIEVKEPETLVWSLVGGPYEDISIQADADAVPGSDTAAAGLIFHYQDRKNFYLFSVSNDGYYMLEVLQNDEWITLIDQTQSDGVSAGRNTLRVETSGNRIALYVNDTLLEETADDTFTSGDAGLAVSTFADSTGAISFDNLLIARKD